MDSLQPILAQKRRVTEAFLSLSGSTLLPSQAKNNNNNNNTVTFIDSAKDQLNATSFPTYVTQTQHEQQQNQLQIQCPSRRMSTAFGSSSIFSESARDAFTNKDSRGGAFVRSFSAAVNDYDDRHRDDDDEDLVDARAATVSRGRGDGGGGGGSDLVPMSTQGWYDELNDDSSEADDALFSKLVSQFANTIKFDESMNTLLSGQDGSGDASVVISPIDEKEQQQQPPTTLFAATASTTSTTITSRTRSRSFFRKSADQTRSILLETTKKMDEQANHSSREQIHAVDFPKRLKQIFKLVVWPELQRLHKSNQRTNHNTSDSSRASSSGRLQRKHRCSSDDLVASVGDRNNTTALSKSQFDPLDEFSKDEVRCLWLDFGRVFASEVTDGTFGESVDDDDDQDDDGCDHQANSIDNGVEEVRDAPRPTKPCRSITTRTTISKSKQLSSGTHNENHDSDGESETFEQHLIKKQQRLQMEKEKLETTSIKQAQQKQTVNGVVAGSTRLRRTSVAFATKKISPKAGAEAAHAKAKPGSNRTPSPSKFDEEPPHEQKNRRRESNSTTAATTNNDNSTKRHQRINDAIGIIAQLQKWNEVAINKKSLAEFALLSGIEIDGAASHHSRSNAPGEDDDEHVPRLLPAQTSLNEFDPAWLDAGNDLSPTLLLAPATASGVLSATSSSPSLNGTARRPSAYLLGATTNRDQQAGATRANKESFSPLSRSTKAIKRKSFTFLEVMQWICCADSDLAQRDRHAKLKARMRAHGCRPLSTKTIDSLFSVFAAFDEDGSGELDRDEIGALFNLMTNSAANVTMNRDDDSPMSPVALVKKATQQRRTSVASLPGSGGGSVDDNNDGAEADDVRSNSSSASANWSPKFLSPTSAQDGGAVASSQEVAVSFEEYNNHNNNSNSNSNHQRQPTSTTLSAEDLEILMDVIDTDGSGTIDFEEALLLLASDLDRGFFGKLKFANSLQADDDNDNVKKKEKGISTAFQPVTTSDDSDESATSSSSGSDDDDDDDDDSDGGFFSHSKKSSFSSSSKISPQIRTMSSSTLRRGLRESGLDHKIMHCFRKHDPLRTGYISLGNLRQTILELAGAHLTLEQVDDIVDAANGIRGDGYIHYLTWDALWQCARGETSLKE